MKNLLTNKITIGILFGVVIIGAGLFVGLSGDAEPESTDEPVLTEQQEQVEKQNRIVNNQATDEDKLTLEQVAEHASADDCWTVNNNWVYDITDIIDSLPKEYTYICGKDGSLAIAAGLKNDGSKLGQSSGLSVNQLNRFNAYLIGQLQTD